MKLRLLALLVALLTSLPVNTHATVRYVDLTCINPTPPFLDWTTAATNIQDAIDASVDGDQIWVTNGVYETGGKVMAGDLTNRVALNKAVTVQSVNGPQATILRGGGNNGTAAVRCAWLTNGAALIGFTLQGGATRASGDLFTLQSGGGVWCASSNALVANCLIVSNAAVNVGGGVFQGTIRNSLISSNSGPILGCGSYGANLSSCTVVGNLRVNSYAVYLGQFTNCILYYNPNNYSSGNSILSYCCTTPAAPGTGNFTAAPQLFVDDIHLLPGSPCNGTGTNLVWGTDLFGQTWANPPSVGCAEWQPTAFILPPQLRLTSNPIGFTVGVSALDGQPPFSFWWVHNGAPLQDDGHFAGTQTTNVVATGVLETDGGSYQLVVSNAFGVVTSSVAPLAVHCVDAGSAAPVSPYSTWASAATTIQDAIDVAGAGDVVLVTNGVYATGGKVMAGDLTNRVALDKALTVLSVGGAWSTVIQGAWDPVSTNGPGAVRCAWLTNGALLSGFTLQNGATRASGSTGSPTTTGGGVWCSSSNAVVSNCILSNNSAIYGGGIGYGTLNNSLVIDNIANSLSGNGGGAYYATLNNCTVLGNMVMSPFSSSGAGTYDCAVQNSIVAGNFNYNSFGPYQENDYAYDQTYTRTRYTYSCSYPTPPGAGNIGGGSAFLDVFHISFNSACRGAGSALYASGTDLDGEPWANPPSMGCDEVVLANLVGPLSVNLSAWQTNMWASPASLWTPHYDTLWGTIAGRASRVEWNYGDGPTVTNSGATTSKAWTNPGDYTVTFTAFNTDNPGGVTTNLLIHVTVPRPPQLQALTLVSNKFGFQFAGETNADYSVQYTTNLVPPVTWQTLQS